MLKPKKIIKVGIGFATGRKHFRKVLKTYIYSWLECGLTEDALIEIHPIIAYDLTYANTQKIDFTNLRSELTDLVSEVHFVDADSIAADLADLIDQQSVTQQEADLVFQSGYAGMRNAILFTAIKNKMDYLLFLDDDEYPVAVTNTRSTAVWGGQHVLATHLNYIKNADITNGHHCGYVSPIPQIEFNKTMNEADFRQLIEALGNDIINWENIRSVMQNGGVTYADTRILTSDTAQEVEEVNHAKFISGANLCINLTDPTRVSPFFNPPGARGEDTFLSTCLTERKVLRVPCYTFHDGFSTYNHLTEGVLPIKLKSIQANRESIINRFYRACVGWVRYKPLLLRLTQPENYENRIEQMRTDLSVTLPKASRFFQKRSFLGILKELDQYHATVDQHAQQFQDVKAIWAHLMIGLTDLAD